MNSTNHKKSITLVFPGQGSQYVGMGLAHGIYPSVKKYYEMADQILDLPISNICYQGPEETLKLTYHTQPALLIHSIALFDLLHPILANSNFEIKQVMGHSVGEYSALVAAQVLSFEQALRAVYFRGQFMQQAVPVGLGQMFAILRGSADLIEQACKEVSTEHEFVACANYNGPEQIVIAGHSRACQKAVEWLEKNSTSKIRAIQLPVSAPFHCQLMQPAAIQLEKVLNEIIFSPNQIPYVANINAEHYDISTNPQTIRQNLIDQVCGSVLWTQSIQKIEDDSLVIEVGPGKVLKGLIQKINPTLKVFCLDEDPSLSKIQEFLK